MAARDHLWSHHGVKDDIASIATPDHCAVREVDHLRLHLSAVDALFVPAQACKAAILPRNALLRALRRRLEELCGSHAGLPGRLSRSRGCGGTVGAAGRRQRLGRRQSAGVGRALPRGWRYALQLLPLLADAAQQIGPHCREDLRVHALTHSLLQVLEGVECTCSLWRQNLPTNHAAVGSLLRAVHLLKPRDDSPALGGAEGHRGSGSAAPRQAGLTHRAAWNDLSILRLLQLDLHQAPLGSCVLHSLALCLDLWLGLQQCHFLLLHFGLGLGLGQNLARSPAAGPCRLAAAATSAAAGTSYWGRNHNLAGSHSHNHPRNHPA
mmetsp:Transcript_120525/g.286328  ORF Transcript_120525/g.286328 Transcript_120525/m.286328 type:complete len:323 (-) Transcript_120525:45-1013(-)